MAFDTPPAAGVNFRDWAVAKQYWLAAVEKAIPFGLGHYGPRESWQYDDFTITAVADNGDGTYTLTDSSKSTDPAWLATSGWPVTPALRWVEWVAAGTGTEWAATSYDVIIDAPCEGVGGDQIPDPRGVIQAPIVGNTATTVTVTGLAERITERTVANLAALVGRVCRIIKRGGVNWTRLFPAWPNDLVWASGAAESAAAGTLTSTRAIKHLSVLVGKDVLYRDGANVLQRGRITAAAGRTLTYTGTTAPATVDGAFYVVAADGYYQWGRAADCIRSYYRGLTSGYYSHDPRDDSLGVADLPRMTFDYTFGIAGFCDLSPTSVPIYFVDFFPDEDQVCDSFNDEPVAPAIWTTLPALWRWFAGFCGGYVDSAGGFGAALPTFVLATWLESEGINSQRATLGAYDAGNTRTPVTLTVPYTPITVYLAVLDTDGDTLLASTAYAGAGTYDGTYLSGSGLSAAHDGKTVVVTLGPTRIVPRRFARLFDSSQFIPDLDAGAVADVSDAFPGGWSVIPKSTRYLAAAADGIVGDSALAADAFANGDLARYVGRPWADPSISPARAQTSPPDPLAAYFDYAHVGTRSRAIQARIDASKSGTATGGSTRRLIDMSQDWLAVDFYPSTNGLTHTGTGGGGSTTTQLVDATKAGTATWAAGRFTGFSGPMVGFTVEFLMSGSSFSDPDAVIEKRLVATGDGVTGTLTWAESLPATCDGLSYRIVEPAVLNRWAGRTLRLRTPGGGGAEVVVDGNCGDTLFFPAVGFVVDATTTYEIVDPRCGRVMRRSGGAWTETAATEVDPRAPNPHFRANPNNNCETLVTRYGFPLPMDVTYSFLVGWQELTDAICALWQTRHGITWTNNPGTGAEDNKKIAGAGNEEDWPQGFWNDPAFNPVDANFCEQQWQAAHGAYPADVDSWAFLFDGAIDGRADPGFTFDANGCRVEFAPYSLEAGSALAVGYVNETPTQADGTPPIVRAYGTLNGQGATANAERLYSYARVAVDQPRCPLGNTIEYWAYATIDPSDHDEGGFCTGGTDWQEFQFSANGDPVGYRQWVNWYTEDPDALGFDGTAEVRYSGPLGINQLGDPPVQPALPVPVSCGTGWPKSAYRGYYVQDAFAVVRWNMKYVH